VFCIENNFFDELVGKGLDYVTSHRKGRRPD